MTSKKQVRRWCEHVGFEVTETSNPGVEWAWHVRMGVWSVVVHRPRGKDFIQVMSQVQPSPKHRRAFDRASDVDRQRILRAIADATMETPWYHATPFFNPEDDANFIQYHRNLYVEDLSRQAFMDAVNEARNRARRVVRTFREVLDLNGGPVVEA